VRRSKDFGWCGAEAGIVPGFGYLTAWASLAITVRTSNSKSKGEIRGSFAALRMTTQNKQQQREKQITATA
jgi:hypothetical protein